MSGIRYNIRITGLKSPEGTIPLTALREISDALLQGSERTLRLSVEGASVKRGRLPAWLNKSLEFTVAGISKGSTVLEIEVPTLEESAPEQVRQQDLWYTMPNPEDTALTLLSKSVQDAVSERLESENFDRGVLSALLAFESPLEKYLDEFEVVSPNRPKDIFKIGPSELTKISRLKAETPEPRAVALAGSFDLIEHPHRLFRLSLEDGRKITGKAEAAYINEEMMKDLWGKKVSVKGTAHFNPSGKIRFIEAQVVRPFEAGEEILQAVQELESPLQLVEGFKLKQKARSPLGEIWGQWPGEESIDEILSALKELSTET
ncbi:hypothetical protein ES703_92664 [subsurface metagenome]